VRFSTPQIHAIRFARIKASINLIAYLTSSSSLAKSRAVMASYLLHHVEPVQPVSEEMDEPVRGGQRWRRNGVLYRLWCDQMLSSLPPASIFPFLKFQYTTTQYQGSFGLPLWLRSVFQSPEQYGQFLQPVCGSELSSHLCCRDNPPFQRAHGHREELQR
jgi:hypothetical protein